MPLLRAVAVVAQMMAAAAPVTVPPKPAPPVFETTIYGLTLLTPKGSAYCPLPGDWVGSDHGTTMFLAPPRFCAGTGYPSSSRGFEPGATPRIEVYYGYDMGTPVPKCHADGTARLFGRQVTLCRDQTEGMTVLTAHGGYTADMAAEADITLITTAARLPQDRQVFAGLLASVRTCSSMQYGSNNKPFELGTGQPCPKNGEWF